jgi:hypothetical protein
MQAIQVRKFTFDYGTSLCRLGSKTAARMYGIHLAEKRMGAMVVLERAHQPLAPHLR